MPYSSLSLSFVLDPRVFCFQFWRFPLWAIGFFAYALIINDTNYLCDTQEWLAHNSIETHSYDDYECFGYNHSHFKSFETLCDPQILLVLVLNFYLILADEE